MLPTFLCIGTQKAGTSWLFEQIRQHPDVWMPPIKELHYFDHLYCEENRKWTKWHIEESVKRIIRNHASRPQIDLGYIMYIVSLANGRMFDEAWYEKAFNRPNAQNKTLGDITPEYCTVGISGIKYINTYLSHPKIIWLIRDPLQRGLSQLKMRVSRNPRTEIPDENTWLNYAAHESIKNRGWLSKYIPEWESEFAKSDICYLPYKQIALNPLWVLREVEKFLGLKSFDGYKSPEKVVHASPTYEIPPSVYDFLREDMEKERVFLRDHFGDHFCEMI
jgi:hypothetical protein